MSRGLPDQCGRSCGVEVAQISSKQSAKLSIFIRLLRRDGGEAKRVVPIIPHGRVLRSGTAQAVDFGLHGLSSKLAVMSEDLVDDGK